MTTPCSSFLRSPGNCTLGLDGLFGWIPGPAHVSRFFLDQAFLPRPFPGAFVEPVDLVGAATDSGFGAVAAGIGLDRSIDVLIGYIILTYFALKFYKLNNDPIIV